MISPCKDCPRRVLHCHSTCENYITYDNERKNIQNIKKKEYELNEFLSTVRKTNRRK